MLNSGTQSKKKQQDLKIGVAFRHLANVIVDGFGDDYVLDFHVFYFEVQKYE